MKLTYRGVEYNQENQNFSTSTAAVQNRKIIYRGNSSQAEINPRFPWWQYIKQLFAKAESQPVFDPITFWYDHRRKFIKDCWRLNDVEKLNRSWDLTLKIERTQVVKSKQKTKLKYRGVTYYR